MNKDRMVAFSDGVIAIIITVLVLDLREPQGADLSSLVPRGPVFLSYVLSFVNLGIYWNNHHHLLQAGDRVFYPGSPARLAAWRRFGYGEGARPRR